MLQWLRTSKGLLFGDMCHAQSSVRTRFCCPGHVHCVKGSFAYNMRGVSTLLWPACRNVHPGLHIAVSMLTSVVIQVIGATEQACLCGQGPVDPSAAAVVAAALYDMGCYEVSMGDTVGAGTPTTVTAMFQVCQTNRHKAGDLRPEARCFRIASPFFGS